MEDIFLQRNTSFSKKIFYFLIILFLLFLFSLVFFYFLFITSPGVFKEDRIFTVENGDSLQRVSLRLKEENFIKSRPVFETFVVLFGGEKKILPGDYLLEKNLRVFEIADRISSGAKNLASIKVTIPEGFDVYEMAELFSLRLSSFNKENFLKEAVKKEGYLFPDTYFFFRRDNEDVVLNNMSDNYEKKIAPLRGEMANLGRTEKDIITMASIIEKEASGAGDRELISGILWKRLEINMPLQVDAALITYREKGLPIKPISNPGLLAIKASMYPSYSNYLYYIHGKDGNTYFAKNYEEHKKNINKYLR